MKIKVRLSDAGLRDAERQIQEYKTTLNKKAQEFAKALAQKGIDVATVRFANAQYAGDNDVTVEHDPVQTPNGFAIVARGKAVAFIEFALALCTLLMAVNFLTALVNTEHTEKATDSTSAGTTTVNLAMLALLLRKWTAKVS